MNKINEITITDNSTARELEAIALAIYGVTGLPITMRSKNEKGVRVENSKVIDYDYSGDYLEQSLRSGKIVHGFTASGPYKDMPIIVSPIKNKKGETIAAIGTVNLSGFIDLRRF